MDAARIATLLHPFLHPASLSSTQLKDISMYVDILIRWNARLNLTSIRDPEEIVTRHFGESLFTARNLFPEDPKEPTHLIDIGSGAGFPGLPIKIWRNHVQVTLIESNQKKATFLREVIRHLKLTNVEVFSARAETYPPAQADVVTLRAVERFGAAIPTALRLLKPSGRLALLVAAPQLRVAAKIAPKIQWSPALPLPLSENRVLLMGTNVP